MYIFFWILQYIFYTVNCHLFLIYHLLRSRILSHRSTHSFTWGVRLCGVLFLLTSFLSCTFLSYSSWIVFHELHNSHPLYSNFHSMYSLTAYGFFRDSLIFENCLDTVVSLISNRIESSLLCTVPTFVGEILFFTHFPLFSSFPFGSMYGILFFCYAKRLFFVDRSDASFPLSLNTGSGLSTAYHSITPISFPISITTPFL